MDKKDLLELDEQKSEEYGKIKKKLSKNKPEKIDILDFYPGTNLNLPYTASNSVSTYAIKPYQLFPFFKTVIVDILPLPTEELFNEYYGMSVDELIELEKKGKVVIRAADFYHGYDKVENDYLDPILSNSPPSSLIINMCFGHLINNQLEVEFEDFKDLSEKEFRFGSDVAMDMGIPDPLTIVAFDIINGSQTSLVDLGDQAYKNLTLNNLNKLSYSGYNPVNTFLKDLLKVGGGRLDWAFTYSTAYASFLADPILTSLNGTHMSNYNMKEVLNDLIIRTTNKELQKLLLRKSSEILCYDIGKVLTDEVSTPLLYNLEESLDYDYNGAIKALKSLEEVVDKKNKNEIIDVSYELKNEIYKAGQIAMNMRGSPERNAGRIGTISNTISLIGEVGGAFTDDPNVKPLLESINLFGKGGEMISKTQTLQKVIERFVKFNKKDHVLYLYNNYENLSISPKIDKIRISKGRQEFKSKLYQKYRYYEHIYKKIPILRVLIEMNSRLTVGEGFSLEYNGDNEVEGEEVLKFLNEWQSEYFSIEMFKMLIKYLLLYGRAYIIKNVIIKDGKTYIEPILVNPKFVRHFTKGKVKMYEIIDEKGRKRIFTDESVAAFIPSKNMSLVEKYIPVLDIIYPKITNKGKRPELIYDIIYSNLEKGSEIKEDIYNKSMELLLNTLEVAKSLDNIFVQVTILLVLGDLNIKFDKNIKALGFYERAQEELDGKVQDDVIMDGNSEALKKLDNEVIKKIMETQELL
ncbi:MAG: hypothetical protein ACC609_11545 [Methanobacterium formicicum]